VERERKLSINRKRAESHKRREDTKFAKEAAKEEQRKVIKKVQ
jgi:hypothetical protein